MPAKDVTLIGNFTKKDVVTVTFKLDGGTYQGETKDVVYKVYKNEGLKANQTVPVPTKTGYTFKNFPGFKANDTYAKDTVYTADWTINNYQVTYTVEQGIPYKGDLPAVSTVNYNSDVKLSQALSLEGYTFDGWTTADATIDNDSFKMPAKDVTLIGNFTKKDVVTVTFKLDG
ncbi:MAG: InlB B-repeat-containing protein, partial [Clostridiales bacterium]